MLRKFLKNAARRFGARYFVTTQWSNLQKVRPDAASFLEGYEEVSVPGAPGDTNVRDLRRKK